MHPKYTITITSARDGSRFAAQMMMSLARPSSQGAKCVIKSRTFSSSYVNLFRIFLEEVMWHPGFICVCQQKVSNINAYSLMRFQKGLKVTQPPVLRDLEAAYMF